jgi:hypothetical protein
VARDAAGGVGGAEESGGGQLTVSNHRQVVRQIVAEQHRDSELVVARLVEWVQREGAADPDFMFSVLEEFGEPLPQSMIDAVLQTFAESRGNLMSANRLLNERIDERENPDKAAAFWDSFLNTFMAVMTKVAYQEIERYERGLSSPS